MRGICSHQIAPQDYTVLGLHDIKPDKDGNIYWHGVNFTPDQPVHKSVLAFREAYDIWQIAMDAIPPVGRYITFRSTDDYNKAHTKLMFLDPGKRHHKITRVDGVVMDFEHRWPFDGMGKVLAHVPPDLDDIYFDEGENWADMTKWQGGQLIVDLMNVTLHEIGHTLDLGHSPVKGSVMYPQAGVDLDRLHDDDMQGLIKVWGDKKTKAAALNAKIVSQTAPDLLHVALQYYGIREISGEQSHPDIIAMIRQLFPSATDDSAVPWCSIFINAVAKLAGYEHTNSGLARSWLDIGSVVPWEDRQTGDIVILWRGSKQGTTGHVGIYINDRDLQGSEIRLLGGNQSNSVTIRTYEKDRILGIRRLSKLV